MRLELYSQNTYGPHKSTSNWIMYVLIYLCPNMVLFLAFVTGINITQRKISSGYWLRHKVAKVKEQVCCNVELNIITFTWLNLFLGCDYDGDSDLICIKKSGYSRE